MSKKIINDNSIISHFTQRSDGNFSFTRDDDCNRVRMNFTKLAHKLGFDPESYVCCQQTHGTNVGIVSEVHKGTGVYKETHFTDTDALVTNVPGIALLTVHADCIPVQFWDPEHKAAGSAHSGWKGTLGEISAETVKTMKKTFGTDPAELIVAIGPGICQDCFEISADVFECFSRKFPDLCILPLYVRKGASKGKWQLNLKAFVEHSLLGAGVLPENINNNFPCTCCSQEEFYSHRRDSKKAAAGMDVQLGAMGSVIYIKE